MLGAFQLGSLNAQLGASGSLAVSGDEVTALNAYFARAVTGHDAVCARAVTTQVSFCARAVTTEDSER